MFYRAVRPLLFSLDPEKAHALSLKSLQLLHSTGLSRLAWGTTLSRPIRAMGLDFPNPLGLAPGLDKHAEYIDALASLGFGFLEIGAVTPRPQPGNPRPRLFRLPEAEAIINRFGFNSVGIDQFVLNLRRANYKGVLGINLGKNKDTPLERAAEDYALCLEKIYPFAHFATINVSSPNTPDLRNLQATQQLRPLLATMHQLRERLAQTHGKRVALALKIAPDMDERSIEAIARIAISQKMDAVIATNTTTSRERVHGLLHADEPGGLSGAPLRDASTSVIRQLARTLDGALPILGVGGIMCAADAREKLEAGASLVQLYSGLIYRGPQLVREIVAGLT